MAALFVRLLPGMSGDVGLVPNLQISIVGYRCGTPVRMSAKGREPTYEPGTNSQILTLVAVGLVTSKMSDSQILVWCMLAVFLLWRYGPVLGFVVTGQGMRLTAQILRLGELAGGSYSRRDRGCRLHGARCLRSVFETTSLKSI